MALCVLQHAQVLLLAVKPDMVSTVLRQIRNHVKRSHLIISIAAGVTIATLQHVSLDRHKSTRNHAPRSYDSEHEL